MTGLDRAVDRAVAALVFRLGHRGDGELYSGDDEPFAREFMQALGSEGWRWVEALAPLKPPPPRADPTVEYRQAREALGERAIRTEDGDAA